MSTWYIARIPTRIALALIIVGHHHFLLCCFSCCQLMDINCLSVLRRSGEAIMLTTAAAPANLGMSSGEQKASLLQILPRDLHTWCSRFTRNFKL